MKDPNLKTRRTRNSFPVNKLVYTQTIFPVHVPVGGIRYRNANIDQADKHDHSFNEALKMTKTYFVTWAINVQAGSPSEAAVKARSEMNNPDNWQFHLSVEEIESEV
jgi:hypothetical protein